MGDAGGMAIPRHRPESGGGHPDREPRHAGKALRVLRRHGVNEYLRLSEIFAKAANASQLGMALAHLPQGESQFIGSFSEQEFASRRIVADVLRAISAAYRTAGELSC